MRKIIIILLIAFLLIGVLGLWYWQRNPYSKEVLKLEILAPEQVDAAQEVEYIVKYKNNGNATLEEPRLTFEFPEFTILEEGVQRRQEVLADKLGDIYPGEEKTITFKGRPIGKEGDAKTAKAWLSFKPKNLSARYESSTTATIRIKNVPLTLEFDLPSKIETGRDFKFSLNYFSNSSYPLSNLGIKIDYPTAFEFMESIPKSTSKTDWDVPLLNKAEGGRVDVKGRLAGEVKNQEIFQAVLGIWVDDQFISLKESAKGVEIIDPNLFVFQRINGQDKISAVNPGDLLHYEVFFRNVSEDPFNDLFLVVNLEGRGFDFDTVRTSTGQFNKGDNSIMWDWRTVPELQSLSQGQEGKVEFWVNAKSDLKTASSQEKNFILKESALISRIKEESQIKLNSRIVVEQKVFYQDEVFGNTGPIPPKVDQATTYTVIWQAKNYYNDMKNVKVKAILPNNVVLTGMISPESEASKFTFDSHSREIVWSLSDMGPGTGILNNPPNIAFQVSLIPTYNQSGQSAEIISDAKISGEDQWTGQTLESKDFLVNTLLPDDNSSSGVVQP